MASAGSSTALGVHGAPLAPATGDVSQSRGVGASTTSVAAFAGTPLLSCTESAAVAVLLGMLALPSLALLGCTLPPLAAEGVDGADLEAAAASPRAAAAPAAAGCALRGEAVGERPPPADAPGLGLCLLAGFVRSGGSAGCCCSWYCEKVAAGGGLAGAERASAWVGSWVRGAPSRRCFTRRRQPRATLAAAYAAGGTQQGEGSRSEGRQDLLDVLKRAVPAKQSCVQKGRRQKQRNGAGSNKAQDESRAAAGGQAGRRMGRRPRCAVHDSSSHKTRSTAEKQRQRAVAALSQNSAHRSARPPPWPPTRLLPRAGRSPAQPGRRPGMCLQWGGEQRRLGTCSQAAH